MQVEILYFGLPSEYLNIRSERIEIPNDISTLGQVLSWLRRRGERWAHELAANRVRCAVNEEFAFLSSAVEDGDEIAIFSPISGG